MSFLGMYKAHVGYHTRRAISRFIFKFQKSRTVYKPYIYKNKCIFVHIPKSAGKSIALSIYGDDKPGHFFALDYKVCDEKAFNDFFSFCFVRDPVSRFVSAYNFLASGGTAKGDAEFKENVLDMYDDINDFVDRWLTSKNIMIKEHFVPQCFFTHINGELSVDFVGKYENINDDFERLSKIIPRIGSLEFVNKGSGSQVELNESSLKKIKILYRDDYIAFGYD
jgi:hypothetical protein